jgi:hypothetical protein
VFLKTKKSGSNTIHAQKFSPTYFSTPWMPSTGSPIKIVNSQQARAIYDFTAILKMFKSVFRSSNEVL